MINANMKKSISRWWDNLENHLRTLVSEDKIRADTTVGGLLGSIGTRCIQCGVPVAFHEDNICSGEK